MSVRKWQSDKQIKTAKELRTLTGLGLYEVYDLTVKYPDKTAQEIAAIENAKERDAFVTLTNPVAELTSVLQLLTVCAGLNAPCTLTPDMVEIALRAMRD